MPTNDSRFDGRVAVITGAGNDAFSGGADVTDLPELLKAQITHFVEHYKDLEAGKWVKVDGWDNAEAAKAEIVASFERAKK